MKMIRWVQVCACMGVSNGKGLLVNDRGKRLSVVEEKEEELKSVLFDVLVALFNEPNAMVGWERLFLITCRQLRAKSRSFNFPILGPTTSQRASPSSIQPPDVL